MEEGVVHVYTVSVSVRASSPIKGKWDLTVKNMNKSFKFQDEALKYYESRKEYVTKMYFREMRPVVPKEYVSVFSLGGVHIPGYRFEGE